MHLLGSIYGHTVCTTSCSVPAFRSTRHSLAIAGRDGIINIAGILSHILRRHGNFAPKGARLVAHFLRLFDVELLFGCLELWNSGYLSGDQG